MRYEIRMGEFGQYFYDNEEDRDLPLADVLVLLNDQGTLRDRLRVQNRMIAELRREKEGLKAANDELLKRERDSEQDHRRRLKEACDALARAQVAEVQDQRSLSVAERIDILARRATTPHEAPCPSCGGHIQRVNDEERVCDDCGRIFVDGDDDGLKAELAKYIDRAEQRAREVDKLRTTNKDLIHRLAAIAAHVPEITKRAGGCSQVVADNLAVLLEMATQHLEPSHPLAVEVDRALQLADIDDLLQKADCWVGGRRDSLVALITRHQGMAASLRVISKWMEDMGPAIKSWLVRS